VKEMREWVEMAENFDLGVTIIAPVSWELITG
jgi:hypothetical protein